MLERVLEFIIREMVEFPDKVFIKSTHYKNMEKISISVSKKDTSKVIGREGKTIHAISTLLNAISDNKKIVLSVKT
jgi:predicted RNA-binding protein YlqC (UPF0109 family)